MLSSCPTRIGAATGSRAGISLIGLVVVIALIYSSFYRVEPGEVGIQMLFGRYIDPPTSPGGHFWWPAPVGHVITPNVEVTRETTIGYRGAGGSAIRSGSEGEINQTFV